MKKAAGSQERAAFFNYIFFNYIFTTESWW